MEGIITQVIGPVVDVRFNKDELPNLKNALLVKRDNGQSLTLEVAQHVGDDTVRCIAMGSTDGLVRNDKVVDVSPCVPNMSI